MEKKIKRFFKVAGEISDLRKCLNDLGLFPFIIGMDKKLEDKIEKSKKRLPKFTKKEQEIILQKHKAKIIELGICLCGGQIRKLAIEGYCLSCGKMFYEG